MDGRAPKGVVAHQHFRDGLANANFAAYRADAKMRVRDEAEFDRMRAHLQSLHEGLDVQHSFVNDAGQLFDCIPIEQQISLRGKKGALPKPPDLTGIAGAAGAPKKVKRVAPATGRRDRHGNVMVCPPGCIPVRRVTLEEIARFRTLDDWRRKGPARSHLAAPDVPLADVKANHRYAYVQQDIANLGAHNFLNVWSPSVGEAQIFSLAQHWYAAGVDATHQTLEVGWQVYPGKYGHSQPVLFIFWTNDNYKNSTVYNLEGPGFVQTNLAWQIGGALAPTSSDGGQQYEIEVTVYLYQGNWWLYLGGIGAKDAVGFFPTSIYQGGAMASNAAQILFGGETVCEETGTWPPMGSGVLANAGWMHAGYQRDIYYFPTSGGAQYASLIGHTPSPSAYTQQLGNARPPWNTYFFYGGPGSANC